jgi:hypothetical protein
MTMVKIETAMNVSLSEDVARQIAERLTNKGSDMQHEMWDVVAYRSGRLHPRSLPYSYVAWASMTEEQTGEMAVIAWGASRMWRGEQTFECFVQEDRRRYGLASACLSALLTDKRVFLNQPLAVFSEPTQQLVRCRFHWPVVHRYYHDGHDWKRSTGEIIKAPASEVYAY